MSEDTIRIGLIGAGANTAKRHIPGLRGQPEVEITAVANRSLASSERVAEQFEIPKACSDWLEIMEDEEIDAVCIGTWPYMHHALTLAALDAGKHVLCEARLAMNASEAHEMLAASRQNPHLVTQVVPPPHTMPIERTVKDMIDDGFLGDLIMVRANIANDSNFPNYDSPLHWRHDRDLSGNNTMTLGIWYENLMRWVGTATSVQAMAQTVVKHRKNADGERMPISIPDHVEINYTLAMGGVAHISMTTVAGFAPSFDLWMHGTQGTIRVDASDFTQPGAPALRVTAGKRGQAQMSEVKVPKEKQGSWRVEEEFINAIRGVEPVTRTNFADAVKYMEFTDAVTEAWQTGAVVPLPL